MKNRSVYIFKNTAFLYVRMFISIVIGFYTTRVVLDVLGLADYGIYTLVGGLVGIVIGVISCLAQQYGKFIKLNGDPSEMVIDSYPVRVEFIDLFVVLALVLIVGFVTSQITSIFTRQRLKNWF